jgi:hypothetical protein
MSPNSILYLFKNKIIIFFVIFVAAKKAIPQITPPPLSFVAVLSGIREKVRIRDRHPGSAPMISALKRVRPDP